MKTLNQYFRIIFILFVVAFASNVNAQTANLGSPVIGTAGTTISIPINISGFSNVGSIDFKITYDNTVMTFVALENISTDATGTLSNPTQLSGNTYMVNLSWLSSGSSGVNMSTGKFLDLKFNYIGGNSAVNFYTNLCEISDWDGNPITPTYTNTTVSQLISINSFNVTGSGSYCLGSSGLTVGLSGSQTGINYQLKKDGANDGLVLAGTGSALSWNNKTAGTYSVEASNGSSTQAMTGSAIISETTPSPVSVSILADNTTVNTGTTVNFTATPVNGGTNPTYQWKVNGNNSGSNQSTFSYTPQNNDVVNCITTSNLSCVSGNPATSNDITITVNSLPATANLGNTVTNATSGTTVYIPINIANFNNTGSIDFKVTYDNSVMNFVSIENLSADATGTLSNPTQVSGNTYMVNLSWLSNGTSGVNLTNGKFLDLKFNYLGGNSALNFNTLSCEVTDWDGNPISVTYSNSSISQFVVDSYNVSGSGSYCQGTSGLTVGLNGSQIGVNYQLKKNGTNDGSVVAGTGSTLNWNNLTAGTYTIDAIHGTSNFVMNGNAVITETAPAPVSVSVLADNTTVNAGTTVNFTATPVNGGTNPVYQWKVNGNNSGLNQATFAYIPQNNDVVSCILTSDLSCVSGNPATSNTVPLTVNALQATANLGSSQAIVPGSAIYIPINITNYHNIGSIDFKVTYDNSVMNFISIENLSADAAGTLSNPTQVSGNTYMVNLSWLANGTSGVNMSDGKFLDLKFNYIGGNSVVNFNTLLCEVTDWDGNPVNINYSNTSVTQAGPKTTIFTGTGNWNDAARWNNGIPSAIDSVVINGFVTISAPVTVNTLLVENGASIIGNSNLTVTTSTLAKRDITQNAWHLMSSSVNNAKALSFYNNNQPPVYVQSLNNDGTWAGISNGNIVLTNGKGYSIWASNSAAIANFNGLLNDGSISVPVTMNTGSYSGFGFNLLGNPYPSAINLDLAWASGLSNQTSAFYTWNQTDHNYSVYNAANQTSTLSATNIIPTNQGFMIDATSNSTFTFQNAWRTHSSQPIFKSSNANAMRLRVEGNSYADEVLVAFSSQATNGFDVNYDSRKLYGDSNAPQLYTIANNQKLSINALAEIIPNTNVSIPMSFEAGTDGNFTITASDLSSIAAGVSVYLIDNKLNQSVNLLQDQVYSFVSSVTDNTNRFTILFSSTVGIDENNANGIHIFAQHKDVIIVNPANEIIREINIFNALGQVIAKAGTENRISLNVESGYYFVKVVTESKSYTQKVFIH